MPSKIRYTTRSEDKDGVFLGIAAHLSQLGTCERAYVGAIIVRNGRCISWGYNGAPPGAPHCQENGHGYVVGDQFKGFDGAIEVPEAIKSVQAKVNYAAMTYGCKNATHAEANALAFAAREGISTDGATLYVTLSPCETCARLLIAAGITRVVYSSEYRDTSGLRILHHSNISTIYMEL